MKTIHYILIGSFFLSFTHINSQDLKGLWISSHERELRKVKERGDFKNDKFETIKLDSIEIDTFIYQAFVLLDFINDKNVIVKEIGGYLEQTNCVIRNEKIKIKTSKGKLKGYISNDRIVIVDKKNKISIWETFYERITPSKIIQTIDLDIQNFTIRIG